MKKIIIFSAVFFGLTSFSFVSLAHGAGGTFFSDSFESGDINHVDPVSGARWDAPDHNSECYVIPSTEIAHTGSHSLKFFFKGNPDLNADAFAEQYFNLGQPQTDVYLRYYVFFPSNFTVRYPGSLSSNNKIFRLWGNTYADPMQVGMSIRHEGPRNMFFESQTGDYPYLPNCGGNVDGVRGQTDFILTPDYLGKWTSFEFHVKRDSGSGDGFFQMWVDGVLKKDQHDITFIGAPCSPGYWLHGYLFGAANSGYDQDTSVYIDDVVFSNSYIGPMNGSSCTESWSCSAWSSWNTCTNSSQSRTRTCTDANSCGTTTTKPAETESQACTTTYNITNFLQLTTDWLKIISSSPADVNHDGKVNSQDLGIMMSNWN